MCNSIAEFIAYICNRPYTMKVACVICMCWNNIILSINIKLKVTPSFCERLHKDCMIFWMILKKTLFISLTHQTAALLMFAILSKLSKKKNPANIHYRIRIFYNVNIKYYKVKVKLLAIDQFIFRLCHLNRLADYNNEHMTLKNLSHVLCSWLLILAVKHI